MEDKFLEAVKEALEIEERELSLQDTFRDYDEWDSLARLSLIAVLDDEFGVQIEDEEFGQLKTLEDIWLNINVKK